MLPRTPPPGLRRERKRGRYNSRVTSGSDLLQQLNPNQAQAADHFTGPALVIAGAGSGKTRTLIYRIAHLIRHYGVQPDQVLAVTFTNKAAAEMRERAGHLIEGANSLWMSTFHSAGVRILRAYGEYIGLQRGFVIYDDDDQLDIIEGSQSPTAHREAETAKAHRG